MIKIYCTYDEVSEEYSLPWFAKNDNVAKRNIQIASAREHLPLVDIKLLCLGSFDQEKGVLCNINEPAFNIPLDDIEQLESKVKE